MNELPKERVLPVGVDWYECEIWRKLWRELEGVK
jgi:hypothetical protein